ncbi:hypothetical protein [Rhodopseudomonas palustris]|uniref:hypothetical protein n=1 Tax=Rhodopseudomonas palustris TaxID=1076 RepID=UPI00005DA507
MNSLAAPGLFRVIIDGPLRRHTTIPRHRPGRPVPRPDTAQPGAIDRLTEPADVTSPSHHEEPEKLMMMTGEQTATPRVPRDEAACASTDRSPSRQGPR